ncbi:MAG: isochorismatase family protein [Acidimicrobiales bacterium]
MATVLGSEPYPWPYDEDLSGNRLAVVLAGWDLDWSRRALGAAAATRAVERLVGGVAVHGGLVVGVAHHRAEALPVPDGGQAVTAEGIDGFHGGGLDSVLRAAGRTHLLLAGFGLEGPVHSTLRDANDRGYECLLVADACAALTPDLVDASLRTVHMSGGIFGATATVAAVLAALHPTAVTPQESCP